MLEGEPEFTDLRGVARLLGVSYDTARAYTTKDQSFPAAAVRISKSPGWRPEEVLAWKESRPGRGRGPRPSRALLANPLEKLRKHHANNEMITGYDLGRVLNKSAAEINVLCAHGHIPKGILGWGSEPGRPAQLVFPFWRVEEWLIATPHPELPDVSTLRKRNRMSRTPE